MRVLDVFWIFLKLGCTSFGGPVAHLGYFREAFVTRRQWLTESEFANTLALCQFIPGPASSQVGAAIGYVRAGYAGAFMAWVGFTLPSAALMTGFALSLVSLESSLIIPAVHALKLVAVVIVAHALWGMQQSLCHTHYRKLWALACAAVLMFFSGVFTQFALIVLGAVAGWLLLTPKQTPVTVSKFTLNWSSKFCLTAFSVLLAVTFITPAEHSLLDLCERLYRSGALVFGGGHVVLPLLYAEFVTTDWLNSDQFVAGYGAAQAIPGPLFTLSAFIGASVDSSTPIVFAALATVAIFLPGMLLLFAALPLWQVLQTKPVLQGALAGVNVVVVGILGAILLNPLLKDALLHWTDAVFALIAIVAIIRFKLHPGWIIMSALVFTLTMVKLVP
ncbi:chromate efflux transporter [Alteromonas flava]|uniref:chromate efflux transporter n=1 Tax=Alteromonas flava TaxID=2048003 RepID=UPI000C28BC03|nr:chromate efflux transporter [Alteromonas flava]